MGPGASAADPEPSGSIPTGLPSAVRASGGFVSPPPLCRGASSASPRSLRWPQDPVQTPQRGMLVFVRPHRPQAARAAPSQTLPGRRLHLAALCAPLAAPCLAARPVLRALVLRPVPFPVPPGPAHALQTVGATCGLSTGRRGEWPPTPCPPSAGPEGLAPGGGGQTAMWGLWQPGRQLLGPWPPRGCSRPLGVATHHASAVSILLCPPVGHWLSAACTPVFSELGHRGVGSPVRRRASLRTRLELGFPGCKWGQSSCTAGPAERL